MAKSNSKPIRILIVDDHEVVRAGLVAVLDLAPEIRIVGQTGRKDDAKKLVSLLKPDLVLLDICLPDGSGVDLARHIRSSSPNTRVLFLTSFADEPTVLEAMLSSTQGYILKDLASDKLVQAIRTVASGQVYIDSRVTKNALQWLKSVNGQTRKLKSEPLPPRELCLLPLVAQGLTNKEIAESLHLKEKTVKNYLANIYEKLNIRRRSQIASFYMGSFKDGGAAGPFPRKGRS